MDYIIALVVVVLVVPLLFMLLTRRGKAGGGMSGKLSNEDVTFSQPSSDEPTPSADHSAAEVRAGHDKRMPPG